MDQQTAERFVELEADVAQLKKDRAADLLFVAPAVQKAGIVDLGFQRIAFNTGKLTEAIMAQGKTLERLVASEERNTKELRELRKQQASGSKKLGLIVDILRELAKR